MFPFQHRELLTKGQVFEKESATSTDKPNNRTCQESDGTYHARVLAYFPCGRQCRILLKSQADRFLARDKNVRILAEPKRYVEAHSQQPDLNTIGRPKRSNICNSESLIER